ncbi:Zinc alcohol dehydrogenase [Pleurostoma richardsiae]|uniref:Zinc alcohol dehydrogenase n=1 Tax=Pleurostoma richardsiae TaxID=41990 RepID=A0AA38SF15_9PEZI|nr:Zinc alcohol dehydrogenase [Pleurostoma richardsiae]
MASVPRSMRAWIVMQSGEPRDVLELKTDWPTPGPPKAGEILIRVSHAVLNPLDLAVMRMPTFFKKNAVPAVDFAGEIVQVGPPTSSTTQDIRVGMTVCGTVPTVQILRGFGTLAEFIVLPANAVAEKPLGLEDGAAGGLMGVAGQTTAILVRAGNFAKGDRVLVNGASGGVGCFVVQMLRAKGVHVTAICSGKNEGMVRRLGAEEVIDYTVFDSLYDGLSTRFGKAPFDAIIDCIGDEALYKQCPSYLQPNGKFLTIAGGLMRAFKAKLPVLLGGMPRNYTHVMNSPSGAGAREAAGWWANGWIKEVPIDSTFDMDDAVQAFTRLASKRAKGKIVVKVR